VGGAVVRNRIRRWCREYVRKWAAPMPDEKTVDINLFFRRQNADFYQELEHQNLDRFLSQGFERIQNHAR
jgi:ribonuclease P protein component